MNLFKLFQARDGLRHVFGQRTSPLHPPQQRAATRGCALSVLSLVLLAGVYSASAQPFSMGWWTVDGGGGMNGTGGTFTISGTIGQPDAGILGGGILDGGFWGLVGPVPPTLTITRSGSDVIISWPSPSTGFALQQTTDPTSGGWSNVAQAPNDNGTTKSLTTSASSVSKYYRLRNP